MFELWRHFRTKISILWLGDVAVQCSYRISSWLKALAWPAPRFEPVRVRFWPSLAGITTAFTCWWAVIGVTQWDLVGSKTLVKNIMAKGATYTKVREEEGFLHRLLLDLPWSKRTGDCLKKTQRNTSWQHLTAFTTIYWGEIIFYTHLYNIFHGIVGVVHS